MLYRTFTENDFDALQNLDQSVLRHEDPSFDILPEREREGRVRTSIAALRFYERSEHSFVAEEDGELHGAIFAQSVWQGDRPTVLVSRVWVAPHAPAGTAEGLLRVCTKSAYDTAVYEVHLPVTPDLLGAAAAEEFRDVGRYAIRHLGTRARSAPGLPLQGEGHSGGKH